MQATEKPSALESQVGGDHYKKLGAHQPWEVLRYWLTPEEYRGYMKGSAIVYLARERDKGGDQDIEKAMHTLQGALELGAPLPPLQVVFVGEGPQQPLLELGKRIAEINIANGWSVATPEDWGLSGEYKIPALLALITSETSEALEAFRNDDKANFAEECADQIIRILDLTTGLGIDIDQAVADKLEKNATRGHRHGGKRV